MLDKLATVIPLQASVLRISEESRTDPGFITDAALLLKENVDSPNRLSQITVSGKNISSTIYFHWYSALGHNPGLLLVKETGILFLGGGSLSASIDLLKRCVVHESYVTLFWQFQRVDKYILEPGELECHLHNIDGALLDSTAVNPP